MKKIEVTTQDELNAIPLDFSGEIHRNDATFEGFRGMYPVRVENGQAILYKTVHKVDGKYLSDHVKCGKQRFEYIIGQTHTEKCDPDIYQDCSYGLHVAHRMWGIDYGREWIDVALLEVTVPVDKIIVPLSTECKVRTSELTVVREIPVEDWYK